MNENRKTIILTVTSQLHRFVLPRSHTQPRVILEVLPGLLSATVPMNRNVTPTAETTKKARAAWTPA